MISLDVKQVWHSQDLSKAALLVKLEYPNASNNCPTSAEEEPKQDMRKQQMKKLASAILAFSMAFGATASFAGGPMVIEEEGQPEVVAESPRSGWIVPVVVGLVIVCAIACGNDDEPDLLTVSEQ
ncbi:hypothetical protein [Rhodobacter sp. SY28-1]|uniref:hypothetical protein n=1 Tax=Rhodobacter sp. SY28-1 TaxID=2562317 RepID=UPI0010C0F823|nr:hypothetical protein [Rhodobacter sp. SY28-1]